MQGKTALDGGARSGDIAKKRGAHKKQTAFSRRARRHQTDARVFSRLIKSGSGDRLPPYSDTRSLQQYLRREANLASQGARARPRAGSDRFADMASEEQAVIEGTVVGNSGDADAAARRWLNAWL